MQRGLPKLAWALAIILAVASLLLTAGSSSNENWPEVTSFKPHGTSALVELLRKKGFSVRVDRRSQPRPEPDETVVAFQMARSERTFFDSEEGEAAPPVVGLLTEFAKRGGNVVVVTCATDFGKASAPVFDGSRLLVTTGQKGRTFHLAAQGTSLEATYPIPDVPADVVATLWKAKEGPILTAQQVEKGRVFQLHDGLPLSNRFIAQGDNAAAAIELFRMAAPTKKLVFTESTFGNVVDPGLLATIGPWAVNAWGQLLLLFVVICYSLGKRFGLPQRERVTQAGTRQLLDAIADTHYRGQHVRLALRTVIQATEAEIRTALRLPRGTDLRSAATQLPSDLLDHLAAGRNALVKDSLTSIEALNLVQAILQARRAAGPLRK